MKPLKIGESQKKRKWKGFGKSLQVEFFVVKVKCITRLNGENQYFVSKITK